MSKLVNFAAWGAVTLAVTLIGVRVWRHPEPFSSYSEEFAESSERDFKNGSRRSESGNSKFDRVTESKFEAFRKACDEKSISSGERAILLSGLLLDSKKARYLIEIVGLELCVQHLKGVRDGIHTDPNNSTLYSTLVRDLIESDVEKSILVIEELGAHECDVNTFSLLLGRALINSDSGVLVNISSRLFPESEWADRVGSSSLIAEFKRAGLNHSEIIDAVMKVEDGGALAALVATKMLEELGNSRVADPEGRKMLSDFLRSLEGSLK